MKITNINQLTEGMQIKVDGVAAVYHNGYFMSDKAQLVEGSHYTSLWDASFLRESAWTFQKTTGFFIGAKFVAIGGNPMARKQIYSDVVASPSKRDNSVRKVDVFEAIINGRVETNDDPNAHIDFQKFVGQVANIYARS